MDHRTYYRSIDGMDRSIYLLEPLMNAVIDILVCGTLLPVLARWGFLGSGREQAGPFL